MIWIRAFGIFVAVGYRIVIKLSAGAFVWRVRTSVSAIVIGFRRRVAGFL